MKRFLPKSARNPKGFTLIELMVVVSIIAILSIIGVVVYSGVQRGSRDSRRKADIESISKALEVDFSTNSRTQYQAPTPAMFAGGNVPVDPTNAAPYTYTVSALPAATYTVCAQLEAGTGGNSSNATGTAAANGGFYCRKNQQ